MALSQLNLPLKPNHISNSTLQLHSSFLPLCPSSLKPISKTNRKSLSISSISSPIYCSSTSKTRRIIRNPCLDRQVVKQNRVRFVQKLKTLLLSKPKHYIHLKILAKCRSYLTVPRPRSLLSMIHRYPSIFETFEIPSSLTLEDTLCVRLTPKAQALALEESQLKSTISETLAIKLQKLLMMSSHHRLLLSKLVHLGPDLGLPPNFRSHLCNNHPHRFKTVNTSYGRALELVSWEPTLAIPRPQQVFKSKDLVVDRPLKFKHLRLRRGLNLKREHRDFLIKFGEMPMVSPYHEEVGEFGVSKASIEAEKRSCALVREVLGMTVEKKTLVDHLTHFRKEFGLSNKLRGMLVRHPELFYVSIKGQRDSVFLMEGYDDRGKLVEKDELLGVKEKLLDLVWEGKRMRKERRLNRDSIGVDDKVDEEEEEEEEDEDDDDEDGFEDLFEDDEWEDYGEEEEEYDDNGELVLDESRGDGEFWTAETASVDVEGGKKPVESW